MAFYPNNSAVWTTHTGYDEEAEPVFSFPRTVRCAVVAMILDEAKTSVRADLTGSKGSAQEEVLEGKILFPKTFKGRNGDKILCEGVTMRISSMQPRRGVDGRLDHFEAVMELWV